MFKNPYKYVNKKWNKKRISKKKPIDSWFHHSTSAIQAELHDILTNKKITSYFPKKIHKYFDFSQDFYNSAIKSKKTSIKSFIDNIVALNVDEIIEYALCYNIPNIFNLTFGKNIQIHLVQEDYCTKKEIYDIYKFAEQYGYKIVDYYSPIKLITDFEKNVQQLKTIKTKNTSIDAPNWYNIISKSLNIKSQVKENQHVIDAVTSLYNNKQDFLIYMQWCLLRYVYDLYHLSAHKICKSFIFPIINVAFLANSIRLYKYKNFDLINKLLHDLKYTFISDIYFSKLLSFNTKQQAIDKIKKLKLNIAYKSQNTKLADYIIDNCKLTDDILNNALITAKFITSYYIKNPNEYAISVFSINAYYYASINEIVILAGLLRPPFYDPSKSLEYQYGTIGLIIAHEMIHAFDTTGIKYDVLLSESEKNIYNSEINKLMKSYKKNAIKLYGSLYVDNQFINRTCDENIADTRGLKLMIDTYMMQYGYDFKKIKKILQYFAFIHRFKVHSSILRAHIKNDMHTFGELRVNNSIYNVFSNNILWII